MDKLNILVLSDSVLFRTMLSEAVNGTGSGVVRHNAPNFSLAMEWLGQSDIHVLLLDTVLLEGQRIGILDEIRRVKPLVNILMVSSGELKNPELIVEALERGVIDYIPRTCEPGDRRNAETIRNRLKPLFEEILAKKGAAGPQDCGRDGTETGGRQKLNTAESRDVSVIIKREFKKADLVLIASSTGGPVALEKVLGSLPRNFGIPVLVVQHMPPEFTRILAQTLDKKSVVGVCQANDNDPVSGNRIMIAPGGYHMKVAGSERDRKVLRIESTPMVNGVRPAADVLFASVAEEYAGKDILAVILTGMGSDSEKGVYELKKKCNCYCITQSECTCVVYGMPKSVYEAGLSDEAADLDRISDRIVRIALGK